MVGILSFVLWIASVDSFSVVSVPRNHDPVKQSFLEATGSKNDAAVRNAGKASLTAENPKAIRNLAVVGHSHKGKTALVEWMLYHSRQITKRPAPGLFSLDSDPMEASRHSSVFSHYTRIPYLDHLLEVADTPWGDFPSDALASLDGADAALIVVSAANGVEPGTISALYHCGVAGIHPRLVCLSKMDRPYVDAAGVVDQLRDTVEQPVVPIQVIASSENGDSFQGVTNLFQFHPETGAVTKNVAGEGNEAFEKAWMELEEAVAAVDDDLLVEYFDQGFLTVESVHKGLRKGILQGKVVPLVYTAAELEQDASVHRLMEAIIAVMPNPVEVREDALRAACEEDAARCDLLEPGIESGFSARVLHTTVDSFGSVSIIRVVSNDRDDDERYRTLPHDAVSLRTLESFKMPSPSTCYILAGKDKIPLSEDTQLMPGDIIAVPRLPESVQTNDILVLQGAVDGEREEINLEASTNHLTALSRPAEDYPLMSTAAISLIEGGSEKSKTGKRSGKGHGGGAGGEEKLLSSLRAMSREDLSMKIEQDPSGVLLLRGMSSDHLHIITQRLEQRYGLQVELSRPPIQFRETIGKPVKNIEGKHKKQSGGSGQFGVCVIEMEPLEEGSGIEFVSKIKGGVISKPFITSVEKGVREQLELGGNMGFPVTDVLVTLVDGKMHSVDSKDIAFQSAGRQAVKSALNKGGTRLLQPMEKVVFTISDSLQGEISAIVARGDGYVLSTDIAEDGSNLNVEAIVPASTIGDVSDYLRAASGGEAQYTSTFSHYAIVPEDLVESVLEGTSSKSSSLHP